MITVKMISDFINEIAPYDTKCEWDNCGLLTGDGESEVKKIGLALDLTSETLENAKRTGTDLVITHHPIIFKAQKNFLKGNMAFELARSGINAAIIGSAVIEPPPASGVSLEERSKSLE